MILDYSKVFGLESQSPGKHPDFKFEEQGAQAQRLTGPSKAFSSLGAEESWRLQKLNGMQNNVRIHVAIKALVSASAPLRTPEGSNHEF